MRPATGFSVILAPLSNEELASLAPLPPLTPRCNSPPKGTVRKAAIPTRNKKRLKEQGEGGKEGGFHVIQRSVYGWCASDSAEFCSDRSLASSTASLPPSTSPFLPDRGVGGPLAVFCFSCFVLASAVLSAVLPGPGPFFMAGIRLHGPTKFRCVASCPVPCHLRSHRILV